MSRRILSKRNIYLLLVVFLFLALIIALALSFNTIKSKSGEIADLAQENSYLNEEITSYQSMLDGSKKTQEETKDELTTLTRAVIREHYGYDNRAEVISYKSCGKPIFGTYEEARDPNNAYYKQLRCIELIDDRFINDYVNQYNN